MYRVRVRRAIKAYIEPAMRLKELADDFFSSGLIPDEKEVNRLLVELECILNPVHGEMGSFPMDVGESFTYNGVTYNGESGMLHGTLSECRRACAEALDADAYDLGCVMQQCIKRNKIIERAALTEQEGLNHEQSDFDGPSYKRPGSEIFSEW